jgi:hypothetical protein
MGDATFTALTTERLVSRRFRPEDLDAFVAYRSDPEVARYQSWEAPYPAGQARRFLEELEAIDPDTPGEWFQFAVALRRTGSADRRLLGPRPSRGSAPGRDRLHPCIPAPGLWLRDRGGPPAAPLPAPRARQAPGQGILRRSQHALGRRAGAGGHAPRGPPAGEHLVQGRVDQRPALCRPATRMAHRLLSVGSASPKRPRSMRRRTFTPTPSMNLNRRLQVRVLPRVRARRPHRRHLHLAAPGTAQLVRRHRDASLSRSW